MFALCRILGAKKRRATVFIPRAAFGNFLCLAWFELFPTFFQNEKSWKKRRKHETKTKPKAHPYGPLVVAASPFPFLLKYDGFWCFSDSKIQPDLKKIPLRGALFPSRSLPVEAATAAGGLTRAATTPKFSPLRGRTYFAYPTFTSTPVRSPVGVGGLWRETRCHRCQPTYFGMSVLFTQCRFI